jgi:hypothetical protein
MLQLGIRDIVEREIEVQQLWQVWHVGKIYQFATRNSYSLQFGASLHAELGLGNYLVDGLFYNLQFSEDLVPVAYLFGYRVDDLRFGAGKFRLLLGFPQWLHFSVWRLKSGGLIS